MPYLSISGMLSTLKGSKVSTLGVASLEISVFPLHTSCNMPSGHNAMLNEAFASAWSIDLRRN
ncbi:MAG: hypothetical protein QXW72_05625 [Conexivisphaerales archaeon]